MVPKQLFASISSGKFKPVYYLWGTEDYRIVEAEKYIAHQFLPDKQLIVNFRRMDGRKTSVADLLAELSTIPMLGERQVIAVSNFQSYKPTEIDRTLRMLQPVDPNRVVILSSPGSKRPKKTSAFYKKINSIAETVEFNRLTKAESSSTIARFLQNAGFQIEPDAMNALVELIDGNRGALEAEINKLIDYKEEGQTVTVNDVLQVVAGHQLYDVYELADNVANRDRALVMKSLREFLAKGTSPTGLLLFLGQHFIRLYLVKNGKSIEPYPRWLAPKYRSQSSGFTNKQLERSIVDIARADSELRRSPASQVLVLEQLVLGMMADSGIA